MAVNTKVEWCNMTWNPWIGCTKVSDGCKFCYAEAQMDKWLGRAQWGADGTRVRTSEANWKKPLAWNRKAAETDSRPKVFCASLADVFEDNQQVEEWRLDLFRLIFDTPHLDWLLPTKRPQNVIPFLDDACWPETGCPMFGSDDPLPSNVWLGTSVENQVAADERIPQLVAVPVTVRFLSVEPLLGPVNLWEWLAPTRWPVFRDNDPQVDWVIVGGESGPNARPIDLAWVWDIIAQCRAAGKPLFIKQLGAVWAKENGATHRKGGNMGEWPEDLRVRESPEER